MHLRLCCIDELVLMAGLKQPLFRNGRALEREIQPVQRKVIITRAETRHTPPLSSVRVELKDDRGIVHAGQLWDISAAGAALSFGRRQVAAGEGLTTSLRLILPASRAELELPVEVRWLDLDHGACFVGVCFMQWIGDSDFLRDLMAA